MPDNYLLKKSSIMENKSPIIIGNWKLNGDTNDFRQTYINDLNSLFKTSMENIDVTICPTSIYINEFVQMTASTSLNIGSQNVSAFHIGAYSGETSAAMLKELGCHLSIIGHSERREFFNESNLDCNNKIKQLHQQNILPVLCIGESKNERSNNTTNEVLAKQLSESLSDINVTSSKPLCVAYEPIWAIGSGASASPEIAQETHLFIREQLSIIFGKETSNQIHIIYGGSVNKDNAKDLLAEDDIDGLLIGGVSLDPAHFNQICDIANSTYSTYISKINSH